MKKNNKNFAEALIAIGREYGDLDSFIRDLKHVEATLAENRELSTFLSDPRIALSVKQETLKIVFQNIINEKVYNFIYLLIKENALVGLRGILSEINNIRNRQEGILEVEAVSSAPISADTQQKISRVLAKKTEKKILIKNLIDESLIGGLVIKINDITIDGSIRGKINQLKNKIRQITY